MSDKRRTKRTENEQNNGIQFSPAFFDCLASKAKAVFFSFFSFLLSLLKFHHWLKKPLKRIRRKWKLCSNTTSMALNWGVGGTKLLFIALIHCFSEQKLRRLWRRPNCFLHLQSNRWGFFHCSRKLEKEEKERSYERQLRPTASASQ